MNDTSTQKSEGTLSSDVFRDFLRLNYQSKIEENIIINGGSCIEIDWNLMTSEMQEYLDTDTDNFFEMMREAIADRVRGASFGDYASCRDRITIHSTRIKGFPRIYHMDEISTTLLHKFIAVSGIISRNSPTIALIKFGAFICKKCGSVTKLEQMGIELEKPPYCGNPTCNRPQLSFSMANSEFEDTQVVVLQENPEDTKENTEPVTILIRMPPHLIDEIRAGDRVTLYGILEPMRIRKKTSLLFGFTMDVNNIYKHGEDIINPEITPEEQKEIDTLSHDFELRDKIADSIAPSIYGYPDIKLSLALLLFNGVPKTMRDGIKVRGNIHIIMIGDPGTAKSVLLQYICGLSQRGVYASGGGASGVGLTAAVVREKGEENFTLAAGTMVLANGGIACIDEMDKIGKDDRGRIHEAMAQQTVTIAKGGIRAVLPAKCSVLAAANPTDGRYNFDKSVSDNISSFSPTLLTRFDLIWIIKDIPMVVRDENIADHILMGASDSESIRPPIRPDLLKKYIAVARKIVPKLGDKAKSIIRKFYMNLREKSGTTKDTPMSITARQLQSVIRLTEASARMYLREEAVEEDALIAIELLEKSFEMIGFTKDGMFDVDSIETGMPKQKVKQKDAVLMVVKSLSKETTNGVVDIDSIVEACMSKYYDMKKSDIKDILKKLIYSDDLIHPQGKDVHRKYKLVGRT